jgi:hypothetical protein
MDFFSRKIHTRGSHRGHTNPKNALEEEQSRCEDGYLHDPEE